MKRKPRRSKAPPTRLIRPIAKHSKVLAKAMSLRDLMPDCTLSDDAICLIALRANTDAPTAKIARGLKMNVHRAYLLLATPQAQALMGSLAASVMGEAAALASRTMMRLMKGSDPTIAYRAADAMMERAGLGISQREHTQQANSKTVFAFAFGAPQAATQPQHVALPLAGAPMGPAQTLPVKEGPSKSGTLGSGEALTREILESLPPGAGQEPLQGVGRKRPAKARQ